LGDPSVVATPQTTTPPDEGPRGDGPPDAEGTAETEVSFTPPQVIKRVKGVYPSNAPRLGRVVRITLSLRIDASGKVIRSRVVSAPSMVGKLFNAEALRVVKATRFSAARRGGAAVAHSIRYVVEFTP
jgi:TonB family protein